jgi:NAD(P)-dependent dehydrogenase (short-subunit alcohol dehydrogenase family)
MSVERVLVMTGGTSGFGRRMVERLVREHPDWRVILLARPSAHATALAADLPERLAIVDTDLSSLASVATAIDDVRRRLGDHPIDTLALNAGVQLVAGDQVSADRLELSFAVNHLAHFLLAERLTPLMRTGGRIVFTSSEVHDPNAFCLVGITRARWQPPDVLADGSRSQTHLPEGVDRGEARYCASKLLNLMTARHLAATEARFSTFAFNPSVVPATDITRERNVLLILGWKYLMPLLTPILPGARSIERSAGDLLWLATAADATALNGHYVNGRRIEPGSDESRDPEKIASVVAVSRALIAQHLETPPPWSRERSE